MRRFGLLLASAATALLLASAVALAYPGDLDLSFSGDGKVVTDFAPPEDPRDDEALDVVIQPDGKIISAGYAQTMTDTAFALARYNEDGTLDASFGTEGKVTSDVAANWRDRVVALGLQSDGKIIAAGESYNPSQNTTTYVLARYNTNGSLDGTFAGDGFAEMAFGCCSAELNAVAIQTDDKIVVGGRSYAGEFLVARYDKDGTLDTTFDQDGVVRTDLTPNVDDWQTSVFSLALQADGKIVAAGPTNPGSYTDFGLARYNTDGSLDNSFDGDGKLISYITSKDDAALAVVIQDDGKVIAGGRAGSYSTGGLARYNPDGSFDTSFGTSGKVVASGIGVVWDSALEPDGKILAATDYSSKPLVRYKAGGTYDTTFQATGSGEVGYYPSLALQSDGKPVLAGFTSRNGYNDFKLARYMGGSDDTPPQTTITSKPPRFNDETWAKFKFASSEQRSSFKCSIDDKPFRTCY